MDFLTEDFDKSKKSIINLITHTHITAKHLIHYMNKSDNNKHTNDFQIKLESIVIKWNIYVGSYL